MAAKNYSTIDYSENVIETNDHASRCKLYYKAAVNLGYYEDPYIKFMISKPIDRSSPEVNRGYALRVIFLRNFIDNFIKFHDKECQIISLGCGFDTLYWHLERVINRILYLVKQPSKLRINRN
ncbi:hypothetical protein MXB_5333 [Myxobolus squamalis]|nr:hypothetical protein MXB_5333 [Myxobolus squamalis]